jgi:hypothetical protein
MTPNSIQRGLVARKQAITKVGISEKDNSISDRSAIILYEPIK